ncbi:MAG: tetratricopeptide repeat protein, partial [Myxococcales bacterium]|nr:tetratricopeptide repeat protein [Myxococcales bacterium]
MSRLIAQFQKNLDSRMHRSGLAAGACLCLSLTLLLTSACGGPQQHVDTQIEDYTQSYESYTRSVLADSLGQSETAADYAERAVQARPDVGFLYLNWGQMLRKAGHLAQAIEALNRGLAVEPTSVALNAEVAESYESNGDIPAAEQAYRNALQTAPDNLEVVEEAVWFYQRQDRPADARLLVAQYLQTVPDDAEGWRLQGSLASHQDDLQPALDSYTRAQELQPGHESDYVAAITLA